MVDGVAARRPLDCWRLADQPGFRGPAGVRTPVRMSDPLAPDMRTGVLTPASMRTLSAFRIRRQYRSRRAPSFHSRRISRFRLFALSREKPDRNRRHRTSITRLTRARAARAAGQFGRRSRARSRWLWAPGKLAVRIRKPAMAK